MIEANVGRGSCAFADHRPPATIPNERRPRAARRPVSGGGQRRCADPVGDPTRNGMRRAGRCDRAGRARMACSRTRPGGTANVKNRSRALCSRRPPCSRVPTPFVRPGRPARQERVPTALFPTPLLPTGPDLLFPPPLSRATALFRAAGPAGRTDLHFSRSAIKLIED